MFNSSSLAPHPAPLLHRIQVGKRTTLQRVKDYWLAEVLSKAAEGVTVMLVGTKADVHDDLRQVSYEEGEDFAAQHEMLFFEASAKSGAMVRDAFYLLACTIMNAQLESDPKNVVNDPFAEPAAAKKGGCC